MRRSIACTLVVTLVCSLGLVAAAYAQVKKDEATKLDRVEGMVISVFKDKNEIVIRQKGQTNVQWTIAFTPETKFTYRNEPSTLDAVKDGRRIICLGTFAADKVKMTAARIDVRTDQ